MTRTSDVGWVQYSMFLLHHQGWLGAVFKNLHLQLFRIFCVNVKSAFPIYAWIVHLFCYHSLLTSSKKKMVLKTLLFLHGSELIQKLRWGKLGSFTVRVVSFALVVLQNAKPGWFPWAKPARRVRRTWKPRGPRRAGKNSHGFQVPKLNVSPCSHGCVQHFFTWKREMRFFLGVASWRHITEKPSSSSQES